MYLGCVTDKDGARQLSGFVQSQKGNYMNKDNREFG